ncbi:MAG TPA: hypothetical protein DEA80_12580 [Afipia sp.]|nr:hypothetical protein [Afipia sp.]HBF55417.1 hypothetical protein [Afipia sp.]HBR45738.1 hypothetical protein [Afipia sp.]
MAVREANAATSVTRTGDIFHPDCAAFAFDMIARANSNMPKEKRAGPKPCSKNCVDPVFPENVGFILD